MKFKLLNDENSSDELYNVIYINESMIGGYNTEHNMKVLKQKDVEILCEKPYEKELIETPCIFNIKKFPNASYEMHSIILNTLEDILNDEVHTLKVIEDTNTIKKNFILKTVIGIANGKAIRIDYSVGKFEELCDIKITCMGDKELKEICRKKIQLLKCNIEEQNKEIDNLMKAIDSLND